MDAKQYLNYYPGNMVNAHEAAMILHITENDVLTCAKMGSFNYYFLPNKRELLFDVEEIKCFLIDKNNLISIHNLSAILSVPKVTLLKYAQLGYYKLYCFDGQNFMFNENETLKFFQEDWINLSSQNLRNELVNVISQKQLNELFITDKQVSDILSMSVNEVIICAINGYFKKYQVLGDNTTYFNKNDIDNCVDKYWGSIENINNCITKDEAVEILHVSKQKFNCYMRQGYFRIYGIPNTSCKNFNKKDIEIFLQENLSTIKKDAKLLLKNEVFEILKCNIQLFNQFTQDVFKEIILGNEKECFYKKNDLYDFLEKCKMLIKSYEIQEYLQIDYKTYKKFMKSGQFGESIMFYSQYYYYIEHINYLKENINLIEENQDKQINYTHKKNKYYLDIIKNYINLIKHKYDTVALIYILWNIFWIGFIILIFIKEIKSLIFSQ